jgi:hypothetical protein
MLTAQVGRNSPLYFAGRLAICVRQGIEFNPKKEYFKQPSRNRIIISRWIWDTGLCGVRLVNINFDIKLATPVTAGRV